MQSLEHAAAKAIFAIHYLVQAIEPEDAKKVALQLIELQAAQRQLAEAMDEM